MNKILLRIEGLVVLGLSIYFYFYLQFSWLIFIILLLTPDLSALGYLRNNKVGSILYNLFHTYSIPAVILMSGLLVHNSISLMISLIWVAHIGMDRMMGYGLKYPSKFQDTHFDRI
ncbi:DUF4260 domain-containing protein [Salibacterium salarium]|uniref:DUF4260 domain-containing protein n=1 Tax=Salibacterium salarium TaxID=284579 RepID=UPI0027D7E351|nr:DUF4260 domain-containing protein [Salibacterium salarium]